MLAFLVHDVAPTWAPLERLAALVGDQPGIPAPEVRSYMYMGTVVDTERTVAVHLYKHARTRRYLNVDDAGHTYEYTGSANGDFNAVFYEPLHDLASAIEWAQGEADPLFDLDWTDDAA